MPIERLSADIDRIVSPNQEVEELSGGYLAAEGPVWWKEGDYLLFNEVRGNRRFKWAPKRGGQGGSGIFVVQGHTNNANGMTRDDHGRLIVCEYGTRRVTRLEDDGTSTIVAYRYEGKRLNHPNDVVVGSDGSVYFTDTSLKEPGLDLSFDGVYRVSPDLGTVTLLVKDCPFPNGLEFSPDEKTLYIADTSRSHIRAFDVRSDGTLANGRIFCSLRGDRPGHPDGMKVDLEGNVYCTGPGGVWVIDASGKHIGTILTGANQTTNCAWGGDDWKTLFITTYDALLSIRLNVPGVPVPRVPPAS